MIVTVALDTDDIIRLIGAARAIRTDAGRRGGPRIDRDELAKLSAAIGHAETELAIVGTSLLHRDELMLDGVRARLYSATLWAHAAGASIVEVTIADLAAALVAWVTQSAAQHSAEVPRG